MSHKIYLSHKFFHLDPYKAFAKQHAVGRDIWVKLYHTGYLWRQYSIPEMVEYVQITTKGKLKISSKTITRWIQRTEVYNKAQNALKLGVEVVTPEYFGDNADYVIKRANVVKYNNESRKKQD